MNERIKEIALKCYNPYSNFDINKFAELIVKECANICFSEADGHRIAFGEHCGIVIKQHFGVEE